MKFLLSSMDAICLVTCLKIYTPGVTLFLPISNKTIRYCAEIYIVAQNKFFSMKPTFNFKLSENYEAMFSGVYRGGGIGPWPPPLV